MPLNKILKQITISGKKLTSHIKIHMWSYIILPLTTLVTFRFNFTGNTISAVPTQGGAIWPWRADYARPFTRLIVATDQADTYYPWDVSVHRSLRNFHIPFWNHNSFGGTPLWTNGQPSPIYPPRLISSFLMGAPLQHDFFILFHILLGGFGMYYLCKKMKFATAGSITAGLFWMFAPMTFAWMQFEFYLPINALMPWIFFACIKLTQQLSNNRNSKLVTRVKKAFPLITLIAFLQTLLFLGSNIQFVFFVMVPVAIYLFFAIFKIGFEKESKITNENDKLLRRIFDAGLNTTVISAIISILTLMLSATAWLPIAIFASKSSRVALDYDQFVGPTNIIPKMVFLKNTFWHLPYPYIPTHLFQMTFIGSIAAAFALIGFLNFSKNQRKHKLMYVRILAIATMLIVIGTPLAWLVYSFVPGMQYLTALGRMLFLWTFALCILTALGAETIINTFSKMAHKVISKSQINFVIPVTIIVMLITFVNVYQTSRYGLAINPPIVERIGKNIFPQTPLIKSLEKNMTADDRIIPISRGDLVWAPPMMYASHQMVYGINSAAGYESIVDPNTVDTWRLISGETPESVATVSSLGSYISNYKVGEFNMDNLEQVGVTLIVAPPDIMQDAKWDETVVNSGLTLIKIYSGNDGIIFRIADSASKIYAKVQCENSEDKIINDIYTDDDPIVLSSSKKKSYCAKEAVLENESKVKRIKTDDPNAILYNTSSEKNSILFVPVSNDPGWTATIDGKEARIISANHSFMAIELPKGNHKISFGYSPPVFNISFIITIIGICIAGIGIYISKRKLIS